MIATAIGMYLAEAGLVEYESDEPGGDVFIDQDLPDDPTDAVQIVTRGGLPEDVKLGYDAPQVQVIVRGGADSRGPQTRARAIYSALHGLHATALPDGTWVVGCAADQSEPVWLGPDQNGRQRYSLNFTLDVRALTTHRL